jgi:hypothetical protein
MVSYSTIYSQHHNFIVEILESEGISKENSHLHCVLRFWHATTVSHEIYGRKLGHHWYMWQQIYLGVGQTYWNFQILSLVSYIFFMSYLHYMKNGPTTMYAQESI